MESATSLRLVETGLRTRSSTAFFRRRSRWPPLWGFLPLGTGNSFLRDFSDRGVEHRSSRYWRVESVLATYCACGIGPVTFYYINLLSMGFSADVATLRARRFSAWGEPGYLTSIFLTLARFNLRPFPVESRGNPRSMIAGACSSRLITASSPVER